MTKKPAIPAKSKPAPAKKVLPKPPVVGSAGPKGTAGGEGGTTG